MNKSPRTILKCENLRKYFGATKAVDDCSVECQEGTITSIIGPNGSGKTTLLGLISGLIRPDSGEIHYLDKDITRLCRENRSDILAKMGIAQSFQSAEGFGEMTLLESLMVTPTLVDDNSLASTLKTLLPGAKETAHWERERKAKEMLKELGLEEQAKKRLRDQDAGTQKLVELGQIFLLNPRIFLLDEPFAGVSSDKDPIILDQIVRSKEQAKTIIMISHKMEPVMSSSDFIHVLVRGKILLSGSPEEIQNSEEVRKIYLGGELC